MDSSFIICKGKKLAKCFTLDAKMQTQWKEEFAIWYPLMSNNKYQINNVY